MPKYTDIAISQHIYISSTFHYFPTIHYKNNGAPNNTDFESLARKPKYFQAEAHRWLYPVVLHPMTKFYEYDRQGNKRYAGYRYHGFESFYYLVTGASKYVSNIRHEWDNNIIWGSSVYKITHEPDRFSSLPELYTQCFISVVELKTNIKVENISIEGATAWTGVNSAGERVILDLAAVAPWRPEFTIELRDSLNSMLTYVNRIRAEGAQNEEPVHHARALAAIEHIRTTLKQLGESTPESEA